MKRSIGDYKQGNASDYTPFIVRMQPWEGYDMILRPVIG